MNAKTLRGFFVGEVTVETLAMELRDTWQENEGDSVTLLWNDLEGEYPVSVTDLVKLCDAVLSGAIDPDGLEAIGFGMVATNHFKWNTDTLEGERIADTLNEWSAPEVNYRLDRSTVSKFRQRLLTGEDTFGKDDFWSAKNHVGPVRNPKRWTE